VLQNFSNYDGDPLSPPEGETAQGVRPRDPSAKKYFTGPVAEFFSQNFSRAKNSFQKIFQKNFPKISRPGSNKIPAPESPSLTL
jgi:hypothetical protein